MVDYIQEYQLLNRQQGVLGFEGYDVVENSSKDGRILADQSGFILNVVAFCVAPSGMGLWGFAIID